MPPELSPTQHGADVEQDSGGGFFSKIPIWAWIVGGGIILYVLFTKMGSNSTSNPAVTGTPDQSGAPYSNLSDALTQILQQLQTNGQNNGSGSNGTQPPKPVKVPPIPPMPTGSSPPPITFPWFKPPTRTPIPFPRTVLAMGAPTAAPIANAGMTLRGSIGH